MMEWKWTKGESYSKSLRNNETTQKHKDSYYQEIFDQETQTNAYLSSLNHDENTWDILNSQSFQNNNEPQQNEFRVSNKREESDKKMAGREMFAQIGMNPYMTSNNYVDDIVNRDNFMKPISSTTTDISNQ